MPIYHSFEDLRNLRRKRVRCQLPTIDDKLRQIKKEMEKEFGKREFYYILFGEKITIKEHEIVEYQRHGIIIYDSWKTSTI